MQYDAGFEEFWALRWRNEGKQPAFKAWGKLDDEDRERVMEAVGPHRMEMAKRPLEFRPHMSTWLNQRRFDDEVGDPMSREHEIQEQIRVFGYASYH